MLKKLINLLFIFSLLFSCKPAREEDFITPPEIMNDSIFAKVLTDLYLCEGVMGVNIKNATNVNFDTIYRFNPLKDNHISRGKFDSSLTFYCTHPKKLKQIQEHVLENLSEILSRGKLNLKRIKEKKANKDKLDSLNAAS